MTAQVNRAISKPCAGCHFFAGDWVGERRAAKPVGHRLTLTDGRWSHQQLGDDVGELFGYRVETGRIGPRETAHVALDTGRVYRVVGAGVSTSRLALDHVSDLLRRDRDDLLEARAMACEL